MKIFSVTIEIWKSGRGSMKDSDWEIIYELYRTPNITKVANRLYMTQPSLTKRLKCIEEEFHIRVVDRTTKGVKFTPEGKLLAKRAEHYMAFIKETKREMMMYRENMEGTIIIGSAYSYHKHALNDILVGYARNCPYTNLEVVNDASNVVFRKVCEGNVDVGFVRGDYDGPVIRKLVDVDEAYILSKESVELGDLPKMQRIEYKSNDRTRELIDTWWNRVFDEPPLTGVSVSYIDFAWQLIDRGMGYTCCFIPKDFKNEWNLVLTPMLNEDGSRITRNTWFVYQDKKNQPEILKEFTEYIIETASI